MRTLQDLPGEQSFTLSPSDRLTREHRLYQADFLMCSYKFAADDILYGPDGNLDLTRDPKEVWAIRHPEFYPVRINSADKEALLRVPGLGPLSVKKILQLRKTGKIHNLESIGIKGKTAQKAAVFLDFC